MFVVGASSDQDQPFHQRQKMLGWEENRLSRYDIRAEGALPPSITVIAIFKNRDYWICNVSLKKINMCALNF